MRINKKPENGLAAMESAFILLVFSAVLLLLVEGANALHSYSTLMEASREGARMVLREGHPGNVESLVEMLTSNLPNAGSVTTLTTVNGSSKTVTVEVGYDYQSFFGDNSYLETLCSEPIQISARTVMPMP